MGLLDQMCLESFAVGGVYPIEEFAEKTSRSASTVPSGGLA
jgi:hypothetical protein